MGKAHELVRDELLVFRAQDGEVVAFEELVQRFQRRLWGLAWRLTGDREAASDAVQEAWMTIVKGIRRLDDPTRFPVWALRIVANKCADLMRRRVRRRDHERNDAEATGEAVAAVDAPDGQTRRVRRALARLPQQQRTILSLRYLDELEVKDIATVLGIPEGTVKSRLYHARQKLKQVLERTLK